METEKYAVAPKAGSPFVYYLYCKEKDFKFCVVKVFENGSEANYTFDFRHLNDNGKYVDEKHYKAFAKIKGITRADNISAAVWFLTKYFSYKELNYEIRADGNFRQGSYYPVLGRHHENSSFDLSWD